MVTTEQYSNDPTQLLREIRGRLDHLASLQAESIPLGIYTPQLGILEATVQYLLKFHSPKEAAHLLQRSEATVRNSLRSGRAKGSIPNNPDGPRCPVHIFRNTPPLLAISKHLRAKGWRVTDIARALGRDPRNISATLRR